MPDDPYTESGLRAAGAEALRRFPDIDTAVAPHNREMHEKLVRFISESFVMEVP